jgi:LuxR family maltose regulon positive regulatory protein
MEQQKVDTLIRTKLHLPFTRPDLVPRPRLQARVKEGLRRPLTLVTAPAGFGKTTLVASCATDCGMPLAWLSLDAYDNHAQRFPTYLVAALQQADSAIGSEAGQLLAAAQEPPRAVLTSLINDLAAPGQEMALVLDDYQSISSQAVHEQVAFLLEHSPTTFHLVIVSRSDPPLPVTRLRARGQTVELRASDLGFTEQEATQFLNQVMGLGLDAQSVALLEERTEGWIAGLQMAALSMRDRNDIPGFLEGFSGTNRYILDYLLEEVLAREAEELQRFLLRTAILTRLSGPLCDAVTGASGGQETLERLEQRNLFIIPLDDERRWYRYHHLFADLLKARLYQSAPDQVNPLLSRAAGWCAADGQITEAVSYALGAHDYERVAGLVVRFWHDLTSKGEVETVWSWLQALPEEVVRNRAPISVVYCWVLWLKGRVDTIEAHLIDAERARSEQVGQQSDSGSADPATLPAELAALHSFVARYKHEFETAVAHAERALTLVPEDLSPQIDAELRTPIYLALATAYDGAGDLEKSAGAYTETIRLSRLATNAAGVAGLTYRLIGILWILGRLRAADAACRDALDYLQAQGMARLPAAGTLHVAMSEVLVEQNDLEAAETHLARATELGKWSGRLDTVRNAAHALSRLRQARHDTNGALVAIQEAESALGEPPSPLARARLLALKARILAQQGSLDEAAHCVEEAIDLAGQDRGQTRETVALATARVLLAQGELDEVVAQLARSLAAAEGRGWLGVALEMYILRSLVLVRQGDARGAAADLERALTLAEPEGYVRIFLDEGQPMQLLLVQWLARAGAGPLREYARHLLSQFDSKARVVMPSQKTPSLAAEPLSGPSQALIEPLSPRELEVLHLIAQGRTNKEIARQLVVAPGTVKAHTSHIYRKLDVTNRTEAVARARQLGILP